MTNLPLRRSIVAIALAAPAVVAAVGIIAMGVYRIVEPEAPLFGGPAPRSMVESLADRNGVEITFAFIRAGQDPNALLTVEDEDYTNDVQVMASPLLLATAANDSSAVRMLLSFGARLDLPQNRLAPCLAMEIGNEEIVEIFSSEGGGAALMSCPPRRGDAPTPLVAWAELSASD